MPKLSEIAEINPKLERSSLKDLNELVSFVPMASVSEISGSITAEEPRMASEVIKGFTSFKDRDVLVAKITPCFENGKIAHARISNRLGFGSTEFHVVRPKSSNLDDRYLYHFLRQPAIREEGERRMTGSAGQKRVPKAFLEELDIPLPPLAEQRRIAEILDKADALLAKRREAIAKLDQLLQSVFLEMFGDPVTNPKGWPKVKFEDLIKVKSGNGLVAQHMAPNGLYKVYGGNGVSGLHDRYMFEESKIVIGRVGVYCGAVHVTEPKSWITDNALYVSDVFAPLNFSFLRSILSLANFNQYAGRAAQPLISGSRIYAVETILPPRTLQEEYEKQILRISEIQKRTGSHEQELNDLFLSIQHQAFAGRI